MPRSGSSRASRVYTRAYTAFLFRTERLPERNLVLPNRLTDPATRERIHMEKYMARNEFEFASLPAA